jgi:hypothetical protein
MSGGYVATLRGGCERVRKKTRMKGSERRLSRGGAAGGDLSRQAALDVLLRPAARTVISTGCDPTVGRAVEKVSPRCQQLNAFRTMDPGKMKFLFGYSLLRVFVLLELHSTR